MVRAFSLIMAIIVVGSSPAAWGMDLELEPVTLFKCWRALKKLNTTKTPTVPQELKKEINQQELKVPTYTYLRAEQLQKLFDLSANGTQGLAKGLSYRTVDGSLTSIFWPAKSDAVSAITEREAIQQILQGELRAIENYLSKPQNEKLPLLLDARKNLAYLLRELKKSPEVPKNIAERFFGFYLNLNRDALGNVTIESVDFNPSLDGKSSIGSVLGWKEDLQAVIGKISTSMPSKYRPKLYRFQESTLQSVYGPVQLQAPSGSQIIVR